MIPCFFSLREAVLNLNQLFYVYIVNKRGHRE